MVRQNLWKKVYKTNSLLTQLKYFSRQIQDCTARNLIADLFKNSIRSKLTPKGQTEELNGIFIPYTAIFKIQETYYQTETEDEHDL